MSSLHIGMLAGEASGDLLGAGLIRQLRARRPDATFTGIGGPAMQAQGFLSRHPMEQLSVMGIIDPLKRLPTLLRIRRDIRRYFLQQRPAVFIGIDSPDFNLGLECALRAAGIPVIHYVSPSVWAWRQKRIKTIAKAADLVLTLFPFEQAFYREHQVPARFIGHPLADAIPLESDAVAARQALGLDPNLPCLALLPGSRQGELQQMMPVFLATAKRMVKEKPKLCFISASANPARHGEILQMCERLAPELSVKVFSGQARTVMAAADAILVTSGTATLEALLVGRPMVIAYRMTAWLFPLIQRLVKTPYIGLPNLLAGEKWVPEFVQQAATPEALATALLYFLNNPDQSMQLTLRFREIHQQLRCDADHQAAMAVLEQIEEHSSCQFGK